MFKKVSKVFSRSILVGCLSLAFPLLTTSCTTTYDSYGNPRQSVDPGMAVAGAVAAGLIGYAIADSNDDYKYRHRGDNYGYGHRGNYYGGYGHGRYSNHQRGRRY